MSSAEKVDTERHHHCIVRVHGLLHQIVPGVVDACDIKGDSEAKHSMGRLAMQTPWWHEWEPLEHMVWQGAQQKVISGTSWLSVATSRSGSKWVIEKWTVL